MELRASFLTAGSFMLSGLVIANSFYQKKQFYPSVVHLTRSNPCMAVIYLQALVFVILLGKVTRRIFFGQLRPSELEHLIERSWYALTETCLAFTVFRDDFSPRFVALFTLLLFMKCFHWLAEDRVDYMERSPVITLLFHIRMMGLVAILSAFDSYFVSHAYFSTVLRGASVQLVFGFEYAILLTSVFMISVKYILHTVDLRNAHPWENKAVYLLYSELFLDFVRVILYSVFMIVMMKLHTFPLFSVRPMYLTIRSFRKALNDVILSRRAISYMDTLYPNVASEELRSGDNVCIICREEMISGAKKLPCNHIFHTSCLRSWFQRQQTCPTCRLDILQMPVASARAAQNHRNNNVNYSPRPDQQTPSATAPTAQPSAAEADQRGAASNQSSYGHVPAFSQLPSFAPFNNHSHAAPGLPTVPPFIPPLPFMIPFPSTPDFSALTDEEVRNLEGVERRAVEARIQCLRNVGTLLDAATVQLQQYLSVLSVLGANMNALPVSLHDGASSVLVGSNNGVALSTDTAQTSAAVSEEQEIRRRRLEHFQAKTSGNTLGV